VFVLPTVISAQIWVARYNGPGDFSDGAYGVAVDNVSNVYVTGHSYGAGTNFDYATLKYNSSGVEQWVARYNGPGNDDDYAYAVAVDSVGNVYVTGHSLGSGTGHDIATIKYDPSGVEQWVARYNGPGNANDLAYAIILDDRSNVYVAGSSGGSGTGRDYTTVKYDSMGVEQWVARYNGLGNGVDVAYAIGIDDEGNVFVTGRTWGSGTDYDYATVKYDSSGVEQWVVRYNGPGDSTDWAHGIALDNAGDVYVTGWSEGSGTGNDYATIKYDSSGVEQWVARYNGPGDYWDGALAIALDNAGYVYITGSSFGSDFHNDYATIKYDSSGVEQWVARYSGPGKASDLAYAIAIDNVNNIYVTGYSVGSGTYADYATIKYDSSGVEQWVLRYNGPGDSIDYAHAMAIDNIGNIYVTGFSWGLGTYGDYATVKYSSTGIEESRITQTQASSLHTTIFSGPLRLPEGKKCKVFNIMGRVVAPDKIQPGIYFIEIDGKIAQKVIKIR
jgi:dienelactone hydrolase